MIREPTVFILGAGASIPYGFPSGYELRKVICQAAVGPNQSLPQLLQRTLNTDPQAIMQFASEFLHSGQMSIDAFLSRRMELATIGKLCIAAELCIREQAALVVSPSDPD